MCAGKRKGFPIMTRIRRILAGLCAIICLLSVTGCADGQSSDGKTDDAVAEYTGSAANVGWFSHKTVRLPDGRQTGCIVFEAPYRGGVSCDWDHAAIR